MKNLIIIIFFIFTSNALAKLSAQEHSNKKQECEAKGFRYKRSSGKCSTRLNSSEHKKRKKACQKKGHKYSKKSGECKSEYSRTKIKQIKKECKEKGYQYIKSEYSCSTIKKTRAHKKCIKYNGKWEYDENTKKGECVGAVSKKERSCTKKGGSYNKSTKKCENKKSKRSIRKVQKKCRHQGLEYNPEKNECSDVLTPERKECDKKQEAEFVRGKCKVNKTAKKSIKETCKKLGWKYDSKLNKCSDKKKTKARRKCDKRYEIVDGERKRAIFEDGKCSISVKQMRQNIKAIKKMCAEKGQKYDRLTFGCHEWKKTRKGRRDERKGLADAADLAADASGGKLEGKNKYKVSRTLRKQKKKECKSLGQKYDKFTGECDETKKLKSRLKCEERGGEYKEGTCEGGLSKKEFRKKSKAERKQKRIDDKKFRKELLAEAKETYKECLKSETVKNPRKKCRFYFKLDKRFIKAKYGKTLFRSSNFQKCLDNALAEEEKEQVGGIDATKVSKILVSNCYKERNKKIIKSTIVGLGVTGSFFLLPGAGPAALGMVLGKVAISKVEKKLTEIEDQVIEHVKSYALQEGRRLGQEKIDEVLKTVRSEYYQQLGIDPKDHPDGVRSDRLLTKKEQRRLKRIENRASKHWKRTNLRIAKENFKLCKRSGVLSKDQCRFVLRKSKAGIKSQVRNKFFTSKYLNKCLDDAGEDEAKAALCFKERRDTAITTGILLVVSGGALILSPTKMKDYLQKRFSRVQKKVSDDVIKQIEKETLEILVDDSMKGLELVTQPKIDDAMTVFKTELFSTCKKLGLECDEEKISDLKGKDRVTFLKNMRKTAKEQAKDKYQACINSSSFTKKQCKVMFKMENRFIKAKYDTGILRGKKFNKCLDEVDEKFKDPSTQASVEHKLAVNGCFKERNRRRVKYAVITLSITGALVAAYVMDVGQIQSLVADFIKDEIKGQLKGYGASFEEGEEYSRSEYDEYASDIGSHQVQTRAFKYVTGENDTKQFLAKMELGIIGTIKTIEASNGIPVQNKVLEDVLAEARKEYFEQIGKLDGDYLTRSEKKGLRKFTKEKVKKLKADEFKAIDDAYQNCVADITIRKSKCKQFRKIDKRFVKAKYNSRFLKSAKFRTCLEAALAKEEELEQKAAASKCYAERNKRLITKAAIVVVVVGGAALTYSVSKGSVQDWMDTHVIQKAKTLYGHDLKKLFEDKYRALATKYYSEATDAGMDPLQKTKFMKEIDSLWNEKILPFQGKMGSFYKEEEKVHRESLKEEENKSDP